MSEEPSTSTADDSVWCGVPVFNNAATILDVARRCRHQLKHVVVVDDGSTDADLRELLKPIDVAVVRHEINRGKGAALLTAFAYAAERGGRFLISLDGDGQHFPEDISRFLPRLDDATILVGAREEVVGDMPPSSQFGRAFSDFWIEVESGTYVRDTQSGFRAYPLPAARKLEIVSRRYNFEMEIVTRAIWGGMNAESIGIRVFYPAAHQRISSFHPIRDNARISRLHARLVIRQLLPLPHRKVIAASPRAAQRGWFQQQLMQNCSPIGLAAAAVVGILLGILLWPWGIIPLAYVVIRLHLNKIMALACLLLCMPPAIAARSAIIGRSMLNMPRHPCLERFIGAHVIALPLGVIAAWLVYVIARKMQADQPS